MQKRVKKLITLIKKHPRHSRAAVYMAVTLALVGFIVLQPKQQTQTDTNTPVTFTTDKPNEDKNKKYVWNGSLQDPKYIKLPTISAEGFIQKVGVDQNGQVAAPNDIFVAGWFVDTVLPGANGLSIIDGHVSGYTQDGIFKNLINLQKNDQYTVELGSGEIKSYKVNKVVSVKTKDAASILFSQSPNVKSQLNLITCGGEFDNQLQQYEDRVIVYSELL